MKKTPFDINWTTLVLDNGIRVIHTPLRHDSRLYLGLVVPTGSRHEPANKLGLSHFLEHMMFRGSQKFPTFRALAESFESLGGEWNAATGTEHTEYWYSGTLNNFDDVAEKFGEFFRSPMLQDIDIERQVILRELEGELNEFGLSTDISYQVAAHMWTKHPLARPILGTSATISAITHADLLAYRAQHYQPNQIVICCVGGEPKAGKRILRTIDRHFKSYNPLAAAQVSTKKSKSLPKNTLLKAPKFNGPLAAIVKNTDNEYQLQMSFACEGQWSPKTALYEIIVRILGDGFSSRLPGRLREELGLVYDIHADTTLYTDGGTLNLTAAVNGDRINQYMIEIHKILAAMAQSGPTLLETTKAKRRALCDLELLLHDPGAVGFRLAWLTANGRDPDLSRVTRRLAEVTPAKVRDACRELFRPKNLCIVAIGPQDRRLSNVLVKAAEFRPS